MAGDAWNRIAMAAPVTAKGLGLQERTRYLRRPRRSRWQRWAEGIDLWHPRPIDYVLFAGAFLILSLLWIGERTYAMQLGRRVIQLEDRRAELRETSAVLAVRVNALADRGRVVERAADQLGMIVPKPDAFKIIAYVPPRGAGMHRDRSAGRTAYAMLPIGAGWRGR